MQFPWPKAISIYDSDGPRDGKRVVFKIEDVEYDVQGSGDSGPDTGRNRYRVACLTCDEMLHKNTTGPSSRIERHHREKHTVVTVIK